MSIVEHAGYELELTGLLDEESDYNGMIGKAALEIIELFAKQGHSGASAAMVTKIVTKLMKLEPLTPLTYAPTEWNEVGNGMWQNRRKSNVFSVDQGKTHYCLDDE